MAALNPRLIIYSCATFSKNHRAYPIASLKTFAEIRRPAKTYFIRDISDRIRGGFDQAQGLFQLVLIDISGSRQVCLPLDPPM